MRALNISTEVTEDRQLHLTVEVEPERVERHLRSAARRIASKVRIPGFRKGKAPYDVVVRVLGKEALYEEAIEELGQEVFTEALENEDVTPFAQAQLENVSFDPMVLKFLVPLTPEIELNDYREIRVEGEEISIGDEAVDEAIEKLREESAEWETVERELAEGDMALLHVKAVAGDDVLDDDDRTFVVDVENVYPVPGFQEKLVGMKAGETKEFELAYPEDWQVEKLAGRRVAFEVDLREVKEKTLPELNDEFAVLVGDYESFEDLKTKIRENLIEQAEHAAMHKLEDDALGRLVEGSTIAYPPVMLEQQIDDIVREQDIMIRRQQGVGLEDLLKMTGQTMEDFRSRVSETAEVRVSQALAVGKLAEAEKLSASEEEMQDRKEIMLSAFPEESSAMREYLSTPEGRNMIRRDILSRKAVERLVAIASGEAPPLEADDTDEQPAASQQSESDDVPEQVAVDQSGELKEAPEEEPA